MCLVYDPVRVADDSLAMVLSMIGRTSETKADTMPTSRVKAEAHA